MCQNWYTQDKETRRGPVGARRDDITSSERAQIAVEVLYPQRRWGSVTKLAEKYKISRQTVYDIADGGEQVLATGMKPGRHGPQPKEKAVRVDRNRLVRGVVVLARAGVRACENIVGRGEGKS